MTPQPNKSNPQSARVAAALSERVGVLAHAAREVVGAIERDRHLTERREGRSQMVDELFSTVVARVQQVAKECDDVVAVLDRFEALTGPQGRAPAAEENGSRSAGSVESSRAAAAVSRSRRDPKKSSLFQVSPGVTLLATQMSTAGAAPKEIAERLREEFGVQDADLLVEELFEAPDKGSG